MKFEIYWYLNSIDYFTEHNSLIWWHFLLSIEIVRITNHRINDFVVVWKSFMLQRTHSIISWFSWWFLNLCVLWIDIVVMTTISILNNYYIIYIRLFAMLSYWLCVCESVSLVKSTEIDKKHSNSRIFGICAIV